MFTGLVETTARVRRVEPDGDGVRLDVETPLAAELAAGRLDRRERCLPHRDRTATRTRFRADVMAETLRRSSLGPLTAGDSVNVELPLRAGDRLGGHMVQGHVDGTGVVADAQRRRLRARSCGSTPTGVALRYVVEKGSIAVDGVSLTVAAVDDEELHGLADPRDARAHDARTGGPGPSREPGGGRVREVRREAGDAMSDGRDTRSARSRRRSRTSATARWSWSATTRNARTRATSCSPRSSPLPTRSTSWRRRAAG